MAVAAATLRADRVRREVALGVVLVLLALAGYANATVRHHRAEQLSTPAAAVSAVDLSHHASSSAWYCPGPLPIGVGKDSASIELANVSGHRVRGELDLISNKGQSSLQSVNLAPRSTLRVTFATPSRAGWGAASVLLDGLGVGVSEIEHGPAGPVSAPCTTAISDNASIAGGSTHLANNVALALYDPGATPAVANVSFATPSGVVAPPAFQGIPIGAGQLVVENVGQYVVQQTSLATTVMSSGGRIVIGTMDSGVVDRERTMALQSGVGSSTGAWYLPPAPSGASAAQSFVVYNSSAHSTKVALRTAANGSTLSIATTLKQIAPGSTAQFNLARDAGPGALRWAEVSASGGAAIVVSRGLEIASAIGVPSSGPKQVSHGHVVRSAYLLPARVPPGTSETGGSPQLSRGWLLSGGESDASASEVVTFANPSADQVQVSVHAVGASSAVQKALARLGQIGLAPHSVLPVDLASLTVTAPALTLVVRASGSIACGADLYARGSSGSVGFNASAAIPVV